MRRFCACVILSISLLFSAPPARALDAQDLMGYFVQMLSPYGRWSNLAPYGQVWEPNTRADFRPYSEGRWIYTREFGWVWQPEEEWGNIAYHYGRWTNRNNRWYWVPDSTWGPAWVDWRTSDEYIGWAPLPPDEDWNYTGNWRPRPRWRDYDGPIGYSFVPFRYFTAGNLRNYYVPRARVRPLYVRSQNVTAYRTLNDRVVNEGPRLDVVQSHTGRTIAPAPFVPRSIGGKELPAPPQVRPPVVRARLSEKAFEEQQRKSARERQRRASEATRVHERRDGDRRLKQERRREEEKRRVEERRHEEKRAHEARATHNRREVEMKARQEEARRREHEVRAGERKRDSAPRRDRKEVARKSAERDKGRDTHAAAPKHREARPTHVEKDQRERTGDARSRAEHEAREEERAKADPGITRLVP